MSKWSRWMVGRILKVLVSMLRLNLRFLLLVNVRGLGVGSGVGGS